MNCKHHPKYDPSSGEPTELWTPVVDPHHALTAVSCPYCWQAYADSLEERIEALSDIIRGMAKYSKTVLEGSFKRALGE